ncbi:hypothetical protein IRJ41_007242 [Triplophysa rosa]|uniref:Uncharacterized protein n=1 Tax=Triplophysa rosa TaxID=992332 RepID=A0A9W7T6R1_TRIRA|nr:hypothetical protein IRJ41_007242 [Triplophysa rosa]
MASSEACCCVWLIRKSKMLWFFAIPPQKLEKGCERGRRKGKHFRGSIHTKRKSSDMENVKFQRTVESAGFPPSWAGFHMEGNLKV